MRRVKALRTQADTDCSQTAISYAKSYSNFITVSQWSTYEELFHRKAEQKLSEDNQDARGREAHCCYVINTRGEGLHAM